MPQSPIQILLTFALGAAALHGAYLCLLFFGKKRNQMLGVALVAVSAYLLNYLLFLTGIIREWPNLLGLFFPFIYLAGPAFYLFVKQSLAPGFRLRQFHWLHLLPFLYGWYEMRPVFFMETARKKAIIEYLLDPASVYALGGILKGNIHIYVLLGYVISAWLFSKKAESETIVLENQDKARWCRRFCAFFGLLLLLDLGIKIGANLLLIPAFNMEYLLAALVALSVHLVGYHALGRVENFPKILPETPQNGKYRSSPLDAEKLERGKSNLIKLMETEQPFLDAELKISGLAQQLGIPSHHLSQILNEAVGLNFNDFVNGYRIEEAKRRLSDGKHRHLSLEALGMDCGFSSKTTFNRAFKKMENCTPSEYEGR